MIERQPCDLCQGTQFELLSDRDRRGQDLATVICRECGLVSHQTIPGRRELEDYYRRQYRREYHGEYMPSPQRTVREWHRGRALVRRLQPFLQSGDRIFEIGSGIGCNVKNLELAGYPTTGVEPGEGFVQFSRKVLQCRVQAGWLADLPPKPIGDVILLIHVLEHLPSPRATLLHIRQLLHPGGRLYVEVPNLAGPHAAPGKLFHYAHIYNFTPRTLRALAVQAGMEVTQLSGQRDKVLRMVLYRSEAPLPNSAPDCGGYDECREALSRSNWWTYHVRAKYLRGRADRFWQRLACRWRARQKLAAILEEVQRHQTACELPALVGAEA